MASSKISDVFVLHGTIYEIVANRAEAENKTHGLALDSIVQEWVAAKVLPSNTVSFDYEELEDLRDKIITISELADMVIDKLQKVRI